MTTMVVNRRRGAARRVHAQSRISRCRPSGSSARSRPRPAAESFHFLDASRIANAVAGQTIAANMVMLGYAYQIGALPLSAEAIERAIDAQRRGGGDEQGRVPLGPPCGRRSERARAAASRPRPAPSPTRAGCRRSFDETVARRVAFLTDYQDAAYAARYRDWVEKAKAAEAAKAPGKRGLAEAVARNLFKLMAYKDEYEVARLYTNGEFLRQVAEEFDGENLRFEFHLAPPLLARRDPATGAAAQDDVRALDDAAVPAAGAAQVPARHCLRSVRLYGRAAHRAQAHRRLRGDARRAVGASSIPRTITSRSASRPIPEKIRGFGHVKMRHLAGRQGRRGRAARPLPLGLAAISQGGGVGRFPFDHGPRAWSSVALDLTFLPVLRRVLRRNVKSNATLES